MKRIFFIILTFLSFSAVLDAQSFNSMFRTDMKGRVSYSIRAGYNVSGMYGFVVYGGEKTNINDRVSNGGKVVPFSGANIYGIVDIPVTNGFYIQSGLGFSSKGTAERYKDVEKSDTKYEKNVETFADVPYYLEVPILASFRGDICNNVNLQAGVGPYFAVAIAGRNYDIDRGVGHSKKTKERGHFRDVESKPLFSKDDSSISRFDAGLVFTAGVTLFKHYYAGVSYDLGLNNLMSKKYLKQLNDVGATGYMHNGTFSISVGYTF